MSKFSRMVILTAIALIIVPQPAHAGWMRTYGGPSGDGADWVEITDDGSYITCGGTLVGGNAFGFLLKTSPEGDSLWMPTYRGASGASTQFYCIQQTADKGYVMTGYGFGEDFTPDICLMKTDSAGDSLWARLYKGDDDGRGWFVRQTTDGGYIITGTSGPADKSDLWVVRTDSLGDTLWVRTYGDEGDDWGYCIRQTSDGNYVVAGRYDGQYAWLLKIDDNGDTLWTRTYGTSGAFARNVQLTTDGGYIITGINEGGVYLVKTDSLGDTLWTRLFVANNENIGHCVQQTADEGYVVVAWKNFNRYDLCKSCDGWLLKTDASGDTLWTRTFALTPGKHNSLSAVHQTSDGGYIIAGTTGYGDAEKGFEVWLIKTDSLGSVGIAEIDNPSVVETATTVDTHITLYYSDHPDGFHAYVYDASGQKVGEIHSNQTEGTVTWGECYGAGVYFIRVGSGSSPNVQKVVLVK